ncbi:MAG: NAD-dependent epimerase/dehydratase family protein [Deltaproteobacteria bacterium]
MKILLTGATGFIGSHVARKLAAEGCDVYALVRPGSDARRIADLTSSMQIIACDLFSTSELRERVLAVKPDACIHLAWYVEPGKYLSSPENLRYMSRSLELAQILADAGCPRFIGAGTCFEYDLSCGYLSERSPTRPETLYASSKLSVYLNLEQLARLNGISVSWMRFFYLYGPCEDRRRLVPSVATALLSGREARVTSGGQVRDFIHVEDAASAVWAIVRRGISGAVNIASGAPASIRHIVATIGEVTGRGELIAYGAYPTNPADAKFICADNARLVHEAGWTPEYDLERGIRLTVDWWREELLR